MKTFWQTIWFSFLFFIPPFLAYLSGPDSFIDAWKKDGYLGPNFNISTTKQIVLVVGILITSGYLTIANELKTKK